MTKIKNLRLDNKLATIYSDVDGLSLQNLFYANNNYFPNCYMFTRSTRDGEFYFDTEEILKYIEENTPEDENLETIRYCTEDMGTKELSLGFCVVLHKSNIYARIEKNLSESYILFSNDGYDALNKFKETLYKFCTEPKEEKNNIYKIYSDNTGFHLNKGHIKEVKDFNIGLQYNDDFPHEDEKIKKFIEDDDKSGLVILHGEKGTGKTTYIRHLISTHSSKKFVFVTPDLIPYLGKPEFTTFLNSLTNHVIILEDCENAIRDRKSGFGDSASAVSTLLNMTDGLLADDLGIKFICTFNEDIKDIDPALLRKGRLVSKYEFKPLTVEKTNALLEHIYTSKANEFDADDDNFVYVKEIDVPKVQKGLTLADIYHFEEDSYETVKKKII